MQRNVGKTDQIVRIVLGLVVIALGFYFSSWWGLVGVVLLLTGIVRWCPLYAPFKFSTAEAETKP